MLDSIHQIWRPTALAQFEWERLHARRPPLGALPVWVGVALFALAVSFPWGLRPLAVPVPGSLGWQEPLLFSGATPARWTHAAVFWALPWLLLERRLRYRGRSWGDLEAKTGTLIRLFGFALLWYPLIRLGLFGVTRLFYRGLPAPTLVDLLLLEVDRPILTRYVLALTAAGQFGFMTWALVTFRLRVAQAGVIWGLGQRGRLLLYAAVSLALTGLLLGLKASVFNPVSPPEYWLRAGGPAFLFRHELPWGLSVSVVALAAAWAVHALARRRGRPVGA